MFQDFFSFLMANQEILKVLLKAKFPLEVVELIMGFIIICSGCQSKLGNVGLCVECKLSSCDACCDQWLKCEYCTSYVCRQCHKHCKKCNETWLKACKTHSLNECTDCHINLCRKCTPFKEYYCPKCDECFFRADSPSTMLEDGYFSSSEEADADGGMVRLEDFIEYSPAQRERFLEKIQFDYR